MKMIKICLLLYFLSGISLTTYAQDWAGIWDTNFGEVRLHQKSVKVFGDYADKGMIDAMVAHGNTVKGRFSNGKKEGWFEWTRKGENFQGTWGWKGQKTAGKWTGKRSHKVATPRLTSHPLTGEWDTPKWGKVQLTQQGFDISGKFPKDRSTLSGVLDFKTNRIKGSIYRKGKSHQFELYLKTPRSNPRLLWIGNFEEKSGTGKLNSNWYVKREKKKEKQYNSGKFKSDTYGSIPVQSSTTTKSLITTPPKRKIFNKKEVVGTYRVTVTRVITNVWEDVGTHKNQDMEEVVKLSGSARIRVFSVAGGSQIEISPKNRKSKKVWEASDQFPIGIQQKTYNKKQVFDNINKWTLTYYGEKEIDRSREYVITDALASQSLKFMVQRQVNIVDHKSFNEDYKLSSTDATIHIMDLVPGKEYFTRTLDWDKQGVTVGFKVEKINNQTN